MRPDDEQAGEVGGDQGLSVHTYRAIFARPDNVVPDVPGRECRLRAPQDANGFEQVGKLVEILLVAPRHGVHRSALESPLAQPLQGTQGVLGGRELDETKIESPALGLELRVARPM